MVGHSEYDALEGVRMSPDEIDAFLIDQGDGVLALADAGHAYAIPVSFGYADGRLYFVYFRFSDDPHKESYSRATETACLTVYETDSPSHWRSVLVMGTLEPLDPSRWDEVGAAMSDNAWSPDLSSVGPRQQTVQAYLLRIEEVTGLKGSGYT